MLPGKSLFYVPMMVSVTLQGKRIARSTGRTVLAADGECAVQDDKQQSYVSYDSLRRLVLVFGTSVNLL